MHVVPRDERTGSRYRVMGGIMLLLTLGQAGQALASDAIVSAYSNSQGSFTIMGNNLNRMTEAEIRITYTNDSEALPAVSSLLGKTFTLTSQGTAGSLVIVCKCITTPCKRPFSGYVPFAIADIQGTVSSLNALLRYENGTTESARVSITNPTSEQLQERKAAAEAAEEARLAAIKQEKERLEAEKERLAAQAAEQSTTGQTASDSSTNPSSSRERAGAPTGQSQPPVATDIAPVSVTDPESEGSADFSAADSHAGQTMRFSRLESVLERFRGYSGKRTFEALDRLFKRANNVFTQDPPVLLSDGSASLRLMVRLPQRAERAPQFFISEARCSSLKIDRNAGAWVLEIVPKEGSMTASVTVLAGMEMIDFPLAVAPPQGLFDETTAENYQVEYVRTANRLAAGK